MRIDFTPRLFMDPQADLKAANELAEVVEVLKDSFKSLGIIIKQEIGDNIRDADRFTKAYGKTLASDLTRSFNNLGKKSEEILKNEEALKSGQAKSKDILKQIEQIKQKEKSISIDIENALKAEVISQEQYSKLLSESLQKHKETIDALKDQAEQAAKTEASMGNLGKLAAGLNKIPIVGQFIQTEKVMEAMQKRAAETQDKTQVMLAGFKAVGKSIKEGILDPLTILTFIIKSLLDGSAGIAGFRKELGLSYKEAYLLNTEMNAVAAATNDTFITGEKLKKSFAGLAQEMGFIADYGSEALVSMTNLTGKLGMSNKEAAQLTTLSRMQSTNTEEVLTNIGKSVTAMNKQGKTTILLKDVMKEVANTSKATAVSLGSNPVKIAEAVVAAKQLGTTLQQLESTADSLLNFETSIENELKAELLTGKQMNLERARAAALANDMKGLSEEIGKNEEIIGAFASGNRLAQEATAKALGMNREQLASMVYQQEAMKIGAEGVRAKYGEQAYESLKAQAAQEKFANAVEKLKTVLSSIVQVFSPIIDAIAFLVDNSFVLYTTLGLIALSRLPAIAKGFQNIGGEIKSIATNATKLFSKEGRASLFGGAADGVDKAKETAKKAAGAKDKVAETAKKAAGAGEKAGAGTGKAGDGIKNTLKGISAGIQSFGKVSLGDILKVAGSALALVALTPAIPALLLLQFVNGKAIQSALTGIGAGFKSIGNALSNPKVILGVGVFTLALMGIGKAISFIAPTVEALGKSISNIVTSVASGISSIVTSLGDMIVKLGSSLPQLLLLGPALFGISAGLAAMSISGLLALPSIIALTALGAVAPALASIGIGSSDSKEEKDTGSNISVGGGDLKKGKDIESNINSGIDLTPMIVAINEVKAAVDGLMNRPVVINMDGKQVGSNLVQGSYKLA